MSPKICPLCGSAVERFTLNFRDSLEMCVVDTCFYPFNERFFNIDRIEDESAKDADTPNNQITSKAWPYYDCTIRTSQFDKTIHKKKRNRKSKVAKKYTQA